MTKIGHRNMKWTKAVWKMGPTDLLNAGVLQISNLSKQNKTNKNPTISAKSNKTRRASFPLTLHATQDTWPRRPYLTRSLPSLSFITWTLRTLTTPPSQRSWATITGVSIRSALCMVSGTGGAPQVSGITQQVSRLRMRNCPPSSRENGAKGFTNRYHLLKTLQPTQI